MTMKNELTLKHGVILAAAVLLIAGIAFAGAVGAEPTLVEWSQANINSSGGDFLVDVPNNEIVPIYQTTALILENDLTLDFQNAKLSVNCASSSFTGGVLGREVYTNGFNLTIKNLVIDGGTSIYTGTPAGTLISALNREFTESNGDGRGVVTIQNVILSNNTVGTPSGTPWCGGVLGCIGTNTSCIFDNVTVSNYTIMGWTVGGLYGMYGSQNVFIRVTNCTISDSYIMSYNELACALGGSVRGGIKVDNTTVKNCVFDGGEKWRSAGLCIIHKVYEYGPYRWEIGAIGVPYDHREFVNNTVTNCVIIGKDVGGLISGNSGGMVNDVFDDNHLSYNTLVGNNSAAGFVITYGSPYLTTIKSNTVRSCCVIATNGNAAGFML